MAAASGAVHALDKTCFLDGPAVQPAGVLAAAVRVENGAPKAGIMMLYHFVLFQDRSRILLKSGSQGFAVRGEA